MAPRRLILGALAGTAVSSLWLYWRHAWFFRNPGRRPPAEEGLLSPADGTVVYVKRVEPGAEVVVIKEGVAATVRDILREDVAGPKLVIGIFMSPFDVHYNRAPLEGLVTFVRRHGARGENVHMGPMHLRSLLGVEPRYRDSMHIVQNERTVTAFDGDYRGAPLRCYVVQIGALTVNGIDSYVQSGGRVSRGQTFGMIRIGSQVDLVVPWRDGPATRFAPASRSSFADPVTKLFELVQRSRAHGRNILDAKPS